MAASGCVEPVKALRWRDIPHQSWEVCRWGALGWESFWEVGGGCRGTFLPRRNSLGDGL